MHYTEKTPKTWSGICIAVYLVGIGYMGIDTIPDEIGIWLGLSALFLLLLLPCLAVPISKFIYHRIRIDSQTLRVGREHIPLADIDPASVQAASAETHTAAQRYAGSPEAGRSGESLVQLVPQIASAVEELGQVFHVLRIGHALGTVAHFSP